MATRVPWYRIRIGGTVYAATGEVTQNEGLSQLTTALDFELWDQPDLETGMAVDVYRVDVTGETKQPQFVGVVNHVSGQSYPHRVVVTCTGPLAKTRRVAIADVDLSGMTDGEAVEAVLTACGIAFTASDIQDAGYVLGAHEPILWRKDTPGSEVIRALDEALGMVTMEVADRVVRFAYTLTPTAGQITKTYRRADPNTSYFDGARDFGDLDSIANVWHVTGATWTGSGGCQYTPFADAVSDHPKLGAGVYVQSRTFSSEVIQNDAFVRAVAKRMMRWYNREPDEVRIGGANDLDVHPGTVIGLVDAIYGMDLPAPAKPYTVTSVDRRGDLMSLHAIGGPRGATGTITSGTEKRCNQTTFPTTTPGDFTPPPFGFPPIPPITPFDVDLDGFDIGGIGTFPFPIGQPPVGGAVTITGTGTEGETCYDLLATPYLEQWIEPDPGLATWTIASGSITIRSLVASGTPNRGYNPGLLIPQDSDFSINLTFRLRQTRAAIGAGLTQSEAASDFSGAYAGPAFGAINEKEATVFGTTDGDDPTLAIDTDYTLALHWDAVSQRFTMAGSGTPLLIDEPTAAGLWTGDAHPFLLANLATGGNTGADAIVVTQYQVCLLEGTVPGGPCRDLLATPFDDDWVNDNDPFGPPEAGSWVFDGTDGVATVEPIESPFTGWGVVSTVRTGIDALGTDWTLTVQGTHTLNAPAFWVSVIDNDGGAGYIQAATAVLSGSGDTNFGEDYWEIDDGLGNGSFFGDQHLASSFKLVISRAGSTMELTMESPVGTVRHTDSLATDWDSSASGEDLLVEVLAWTNGTGGTVTLTTCELCED